MTELPDRVQPVRDNSDAADTVISVLVVVETVDNSAERLVAIPAHLTVRIAVEVPAAIAAIFAVALWRVVRFVHRFTYSNSGVRGAGLVVIAPATIVMNSAERAALIEPNSAVATYAIRAF